ncbi:hypothetical protein ACU686_07290 [Yinghuangia aomiensis]
MPVPAVVAPYRKARRLRGLLGRIGFASRDDEVADRAAVNFLRRDLAADPGGILRYGVRSAGVTAARARHMLRRQATRRHAARLARVDRPGAAARAVAYRWLAPGAGWRATQPQLADFEAAFGLRRSTRSDRRSCTPRTSRRSAWACAPSNAPGARDETR